MTASIVKKYGIFILFFLLLLTGCKEEPYRILLKEEAPTIDSFAIGNISFSISSSIIKGSTPINSDVTSLIAKFKTNGIVKIDGVVQESGVTSNDFSRPVIYTVYSPSTKLWKNYVVVFETFTGLPKLYITTQNRAPINSKDFYVNASFKLDPNAQFDCDKFQGAGEIKGRGNSTWGLVKKPYKIKLSEKASLFGSYPYDEWTLLANYADKSLIRNYLAFEMSKRMDMAYSPTHQFVELFLNGIHQGNFMISDQIEIGETRVNIPKLKSSDVNDSIISGGYLMEIDYRSKEEEGAIWFESYGMPIAVKSPKSPTTKQLNYITNYVNKADSVLFSSNFKNTTTGFRKYFDEESFIKFFIINELFKNCDAQGYSSIYFYKDRNDDKLYMGPVWDFDLGAGNARHQYLCQLTSGWYIRNGIRYNRMFKDPLFVERVKETWSKYRGEILSVILMIDPLTEKLDLSQKRNFAIWTNFEDPDYFVMPGNLTYEAQILYLKTFLEKRFEWLDSQFNN